MSTYKTLSLNNVLGGNLVLLEDAEAIAHNCTRVARTVRGEMPLNTLSGVDYENTAWVGDNLSFESSLTSELKKATGVQDVPAIASAISGENLIFAAAISTEFGEVVLSKGV